MKLPFWGRGMHREPVKLDLINQADDSFGSILTAMETTLKNKGDCFELNRLTITGKQVAIALERRRIVDIVEDDNRLFVVRRREPNPIFRALSMGLID